jgi:hypothetical protein
MQSLFSLFTGLVGSRAAVDRSDGVGGDIFVALATISADRRRFVGNGDSPETLFQIRLDAALSESRRINPRDS